MDDGLRRGEKEGGWGTWLSCQASGTIIMMVSGRVRVDTYSPTHPPTYPPTWLSCQASGTIIMMVSGRVRVEALTRVSRQESKLPESDFLSLAIGKSCGWVGGWEEEV